MKQERSSVRINKQSRAEMIHDFIREQIENGMWKPGDRLDDKELAKQLDVSRLSVREALSKLVATGTVVLESWKGFRLRELSVKDIESIVEVRKSLEVLAIRRASQNMTPEVLTQLEEAIRLSKDYRETDNLQEFRRSDYGFHEIIYQASGNDWIVGVLKNFRILIDAIRFMSQDMAFSVVSEASIREHQAVLDALKANDEAAAIMAMERHIENHHARVRARYEEVADTTGV